MNITRCTAVLAISMATGIFVSAQNLVPNPGFETYSACPTAIGQITLVNGWLNLRNSPDFLHTCGSAAVQAPASSFGNQTPATGNGYMGLCTTYQGSIANYREYVATQLSSDMVAGTTYYISIRVNLGDRFTRGSNHIGMTFANSVSSPQPITNTAHVDFPGVVMDKEGWVQLTATFTPTQNYRYVIIGNFFDDANTTISLTGTGDLNSAYYFMDDVCISSGPGTCFSLLPVAFEHIQAEPAEGRTARVNWRTGLESGIHHYRVERSRDGMEFSPAGDVPATHQGSYSWLDADRSYGPSRYYRVTAVDLDGAESQSTVAMVRLESETQHAVLYPTAVAAGQPVRLQALETDARLQLLDEVGKVLGEWETTGGDTPEIGTADLQPGMYLLRVSAGADVSLLRFMVL